MDEDVEHLSQNELLHSPDPLRNLSYMRGKCLICGYDIRASIMGDSEEGLAMCECGNIVKVRNKTLWN